MHKWDNLLSILMVTGPFTDYRLCIEWAGMAMSVYLCDVSNSLSTAILFR